MYHGNEDHKAWAKQLKGNMDIMNDTFAGFGLQFQRLGIEVDESWGFKGQVTFIVEFSGERLNKDIRVNVILYDNDDNNHCSGWSSVGHKNFGSYGVANINFELPKVFPDAVRGRIFVAGN